MRIIRDIAHLLIDSLPLERVCPVKDEVARKRHFDETRRANGQMSQLLMAKTLILGM